MPEAVGGSASSPTRGWLFRAALASCDATIFAMRAPELGIELDALDVEVSSTSDDRGLLGATADVPAGPLDVVISMRVSGAGLDDAAVSDIVEWIGRCSPVGGVLRAVVPTTIEVTVAD